MKLQYLGHSAFLISDSQNHTILIDPFLTGNPLAPVKANQVKADYIILTHAHSDHIGDALNIADKRKTTIICVVELASIISKNGYNTHPLQIGGAFQFPFGKVKFVTAFHGSSTSNGLYAGLAAGVVFKVDNKTIYHCGDTGIFGDMKLIGEIDKIDVLLIPIGGNYTMDIEDAVRAVSLIQPELAIPMHYNTFSLIRANPQEFVDKITANGFHGKVLTPGEELQLS
jgi:L-ascorbate metabolism protein UlaG (beta-lactamase superfamily)